MIERISQSFMKSMREYNAGEECGHIIRHQFVDGKLLDRKSKPMAEGAYFEFMLSGALPKSGIPPVPVFNKDGKTMAMEYKRATVNGARAKAMLYGMGLKFIKIAHRLTKGRNEGTIDLVVEVTIERTFKNGVVWKVGDRFVLDVKYSGLLYDKWEKHGWAFEKEIQKEYHGTQAKQYHFISGMDFYFFVVGNKNLEVEDEVTGKKEFGPTDMRLLRVPIDEHMIEVHLAEGNRLYDQLKFEAEGGLLVPKASLKRCSECPLNKDCVDKVLYPEVEDVDLNIY